MRTAAGDRVFCRRTWKLTAHRLPGWRTTTAAAVLAAVFAAGVAGCGTGGSGKSSPSSTTKRSSAGSASSSAPRSTAATSLNTAATDGVQIQVPSDWHLSKQPNGTAGSAPPPSGSSISPAVFSLQSSPDPLGTTTSRAESVLRHAGKTAKRLSDLHVNGLALYHVQYKAGATFRDDFGAIVNGVFYTIGWNFTTVEHITRSEADEYMNPVMATFKLTS